MTRVGDIACGRSGDKGSTLDLTLVARDAPAYRLLARELSGPTVQSKLGFPHVDRYELPGLLALKFVIPGVLGGGTYSSMRAGMHWQKAAISAMLDLELPSRPDGWPCFCVRPPGWVGAEASAAFADIRAWAIRAEELGFDGLFLGDRLLAQATASRGRPVYGASMLEVTTTLAALASVTERILLGPLVMVLPYRHPVQLAKTIATLDLIAGGRLVLGAGIGWNEPEFEALQIPREERAQRFEEALSLARRLWAGEAVSHAGTWTFEDVRIDPLPAQAGGPPVWFAAFSPGSALDWQGDLPPRARRPLERAGRLADGWVPLVYSASSKRRIEPLVLARAWDYVLESAGQAGRSRQDLDFVYSDWCYVLDGRGSEDRCRAALSRFFTGSWAEAQRTYTIGTPDQVVERIGEYTDAIDRVDAYVLTPLDGDPEQLDGVREVRLGIQRSAIARQGSAAG
jgi:probable F420-dependent oxidoreductase